MTSGGAAGGAASTVYVDVQGRFTAFEQRLAQLEQQAGQAGQNAGQAAGGGFADRLKSFGGAGLTALSGLALAAGAAIGAALVGGLTVATNLALEQADAVAQLKAQFGLTTEEASRLGDVATAVFGDNFGGSLTEAAEAVADVRKNLKGLSDVDLKAVTEGALAIKDTFGTEVSDSTAAAQTLMKQFGLTAQQALDFITKGFQEGLPDDFLDSITEYSTQFKNGGADAGQFFSILQTGAAQGALGTDKAADAFKEFRVRIQDGSKTTSAGLEQLGIDSKDLAEKMASGQVTAADAFQLVLDKLKGTTDANTKMQAGVALLGTQYEDLGQKSVDALSLTKTSTADLKGATDSLNAKYDTLPQFFAGVWRQVQVAIIPVGKEILGLANEAMPQIKAAIATIMPILTSLVSGLINGFRQGRESANQFLPYIQQGLAFLRPAVEALGPLFTSAFQLIKTLWETVLRPTITAIAPVFQGVFQVVGGVLAYAVQLITGIIKTITALLHGDLGGAVQALQGIFEAGVTAVVRILRGLASSIFNIIKGIAPNMADAAGDIIRGLIGGIENGGKLVIQAARNLGQHVIDGIKGVLQIQSPSKVTTAFGQFVGEGLQIGIENSTPVAIKAAKGLAGGVVSEVQKARAELEKQIKMDAWTASLKGMTQTQLEHAQATARAAGDSQKYSAIQSELTRRVEEGNKAVQQRVDLEKQIRFDAWTEGLKGQTVAQLESAEATARAAGDSERYSAIKTELTRREQEHASALEKTRQELQQQADQLASNRRQITDALALDAYVQGLQGYTDGQLKAAEANALHAGNSAKFNAILAEQKRRLDEVAQSTSDLADADIAAANARYRDTQGTTDSAFRSTYGAGDVGLIRSLAATTGLTVAQVRSDVEKALADAKKYVPEAASVIERVYSDALQHRRDVTAQTLSLFDLQDAANTRLATQAVAASDRMVSADEDYAGAISNLEEVLGGLYDRAESGEDAINGINLVIDAINRLAQARASLKGDALTRQLFNAETPGAFSDTPEAARGKRTSPVLLPVDPVINRPDLVATVLSDNLRQNATNALAIALDPKALASLGEAGGQRFWAAFKSIGENGGFSLLGSSAAEAEDIIGRTINSLIDSGQQDSDAVATLRLALISLWEAAKPPPDLDESTTTATKGITVFGEAVEIARDETVDPLTLTLNVAGIDTGIKALDLYKSAVQGVSDVIQQTFSDLVAGTGNGVQSILANMAKMALGIVRQVAVAIAAYEAQAIALALISGASFNFVQAGLALAAAAAVAGIVAGLDARLSQTGTRPGTGGGSVSTASTSTSSAGGNNVVDIPNAAVTVIAAPGWVDTMGKNIDRMGSYIDRLVTEGIYVRTDQGSTSTPRGLGWDLNSV